MRIAILAVATNIHTIRWVNALARREISVVLMTQQPPAPGVYDASVEIMVLPFRRRLGYALNAPFVRLWFARSGADLLHVHYAGGYGATVWLARVKERIVSVWGGDVYDVPYRSRFHRLLVTQALRGAARITSTSHVMAEQVRRLGISNPVDVVPFGVDTSVFQRSEPVAGKPRLVVGTVKTLSPKYGIDTLIDGFALAMRDGRFAALNPVLRLVGAGPARHAYEQLCRERQITDRVEFTGHVPHASVPGSLRSFDIYVAVSRDDSESFGVAVIEASACGLPVIVSDAGGLPEVVDDHETGFVIPRGDPAALATVLRQLAFDDRLRQRLGCAGRSHVAAHYEWSTCVDRMTSIYGEVLDAISRTDAESRGFSLFRRLRKA